MGSDSRLASRSVGTTRRRSGRGDPRLNASTARSDQRRAHTEESNVSEGAGQVSNASEDLGAPNPTQSVDPIAALRAAREAREIRRSRREQQEVEMQDAMLAAALSISLAEEEDQRLLHEALEFSRGGAAAYDLSTQIMLTGDALSTPTPPQDEEAQMAQAQHASLMDAWRESLPIPLYELGRRNSGGSNGVGDSAAECPLCLAEFQKGDPIMHLDCLHCFHVDCIKPWIANHSNCPV